MKFKLSPYLLGFQTLLLLGLVLVSLGLFYYSNGIFYLIDWEFLTLNSCVMTMTFIFDWMSLLFVGCVFLISSMVIFYSESYMCSDLYKIRFYFLVFLFVMSMMMMIVSPNLISILIGWDGLGLVSYCLVVYFQNFKSYSAGMVTILTNRIGDVAILLSIAWMFNYGSWHFIYYACSYESWSVYLILLIILAGFTSSAQIPFSSWLPAAMAAPTPVSALVHSSTLVTAGVYLIIRFSDYLMVFDTWFFLMISMMTMFMSGLGANFEFDLKKVIALSTLSQLGLMMSILFLGFKELAFFHLLTHAFFKALLFLCAGLMIHCMSDSQDIRHMGTMISYLPLTCCCFCVSNLSLCGLPFLAGFYSKDLILESMLFSYHNFFVFIVFFVSVGLTSCYSLRLVFYCLTFNMNCYSCQGYFEDKIMNGSMFLLVILSVISGSLLGWIMFDSPHMYSFSLELSVLPLIFVFLGGWLGYESSFFYFEDLYASSMYFMTLFMGSMWFMPSLSTYMLNSSVLNFSELSYSIMDGGWGEYVISKSSYLWSSLLSSFLVIFQENNVKLFMLVFLLMIFLIVI
uniref:NADH-ubiquinone oxidoreductase chain 5 n=1 Tax=Neocentrocnemis stali TaxID=888042 RepID=A0A7I6H8C6_9HEMI|nr:NADH dehydrogenase subunit 5 [Neocentrocnemis stali]AGO28033.1 NADH dehydrogenase subunit 5 [Neocentrocnemis stali]